MVFCEKCGTKLKEDEMFCSNCGENTDFAIEKEKADKKKKTKELKEKKRIQEKARRLGERREEERKEREKENFGKITNTK